ncbi:MAG: sugar transferase [Candidatus Ratteibacteria bacterium]|nr:sugar transferase [Candidatus Ratteibacteria bacterium]
MKYLLNIPDNRRKFILFLGDILAIVIMGLATLSLFDFLKSNQIFSDILKRPLNLYTVSPFPIIYLIMLYAFGMYETKEKRGKLQLVISLFSVASLSFFIMLALAKILRMNKTSILYLLVFFVFSVIILYLWRQIFINAFLTSDYFKKRLFFIGSDTLTQQILSEITSSDYEVVGIMGREGSDIGTYEKGLKIVSTGKNLGHLIQSKNIKTLVLSLDIQLPLPIIKKIYEYRFKGIDVFRSDHFYEIANRKFAIEQYLKNGNIPFLGIETFISPVFKNIKKLIDFLGALISIIILSPIFIITSLLIKLTSKGPVFYLQERIGFQEKPFKFIKFRTMIYGAEKHSGPQWASENDNRVTLMGKLLRKTNLDELPQLINILKGELSFVGPRPIRKHFVDIIEQEMPFYSLRFSIKPGLTGWAQVNYGYGGSIEGHIEKFKYDLYYFRHASLFLDLFIILKTLQKIVCRPSY